MSYAVWLIAGFILLVLEMVAPSGFFLMFLGGAAIIVGGLTYVEIVSSTSLQLFIFSVAAIALLGTFWKRGVRGQGGSHAESDADAMNGQTALATEAIGAGESGQVELRGATWTASNIGTDPLAIGDSCIVRKVEGLRLRVEKL